MNKSRDRAEYGIDELAERGGVTRRTVRYYVRRGLLPAPTGTGRGKHYNETHLRTLIRIRELQEAGISLAEIQHRLEAGDPVPEPRIECPGADSERPDPVPPVPAPTPRPPGAGSGSSPLPRTRFTRVTLGPGLELNIAADREIGDSTITRIRDAVHAILSGDDTGPLPWRTDDDQPRGQS